MAFVQREKQLSHCNAVTHASLQISKKCGKSRLVTTSAPKHFIPKVGYFWGKSSLLLGAITYMIAWCEVRKLLRSEVAGGINGDH